MRRSILQYVGATGRKLSQSNLAGTDAGMTKPSLQFPISGKLPIPYHLYK